MDTFETYQNPSSRRPPSLSLLSTPRNRRVLPHLLAATVIGGDGVLGPALGVVEGSLKLEFG
jgi:hypothetical protein